KRRYFFGKSLSKNLSGGTAFSGHGRRQVFTLGSADFLQLADIHANLFGECMRGGCRLPILISNLRRRPVHLLGNVRLRRGNARSENGQTARCIEMRNRPGGYEAL